MARIFFIIIISTAIIYLLKKGNDSAITKNENLDFPATLKRGLELTLKAISQKINPNIIDSENKTRIFSVGLNRNVN